jgi:NAD(P)-dependent dehydrogenase (short-subunit alcohol dehydrogenase family)
MSKLFAIVTGASSGIGLELAALCAREGFDLLVVADRPEIQAAAGDECDVVSGWKNKLQSAIANVTPAGMLAEQHRRMAEPGSAKKADS